MTPFLLAALIIAGIIALSFAACFFDERDRRRRAERELNYARSKLVDMVTASRFAECGE